MAKYGENKSYSKFVNDFHAKSGGKGTTTPNQSAWSSKPSYGDYDKNGNWDSNKRAEPPRKKNGEIGFDRPSIFSKIGNFLDDLF